jgi:hypothetical protein
LFKKSHLVKKKFSKNRIILSTNFKTQFKTGGWAQFCKTFYGHSLQVFQLSYKTCL